VAGEPLKDGSAPRVPPSKGVAAAAESGAQSVDFIGDGTLRVSGQNRYATAAAIAFAFGWSSANTEVVYLASGESFPDALALGPSTFGDGPLLLTASTRLPSETRTALEILRPCTIIAVGGPNAISRDVLLEADQFTIPWAC
jgi:putative cell wall-binding protein